MNNSLEWEDEESATLRGASYPPPASPPPPPVRVEQAPSARSCALEQCTDFTDSSDTVPTEMDWDSGVDDEDLRCLPPPTIRDLHQEQEHLRAALRGGPPPAEPWEDDESPGFDERDTAERLPAVNPEDERSTAERLAAVGFDAAPPPSKLPPELERLAEAACAPITFVGSTPLASLAPVTMSTPVAAARANEELAREVERLRQTVRWVSAVSVLALACCFLLALKLVLMDRQAAGPPRLQRGIAAAASGLVPPAPATTRQGLAVSTDEPGVRLFVDGQDRGPLPLELDDLRAGEHELRFVDARDRHRLVRTFVLQPGQRLELGQIPLPAPKIRVNLRLLSRGATVCLARHGEPAKVLRGPFPTSLELEPGSYALFVARGARRKAVPLHVSPGQSELDVALSVD